MRGFLGGNLPVFTKLYGEIGREFNLPVRMPHTQAKLVEIGQPGLRPMVSNMGVLMPDGGPALGGPENLRKVFHERLLGTVTEIYIHPAIECDEIKAVRWFQDWWKQGVGELQLFTTDREELKQAVKEEGFIVIGWREIRELQRSGG
jgi:hypothetical protein